MSGCLQPPTSKEQGPSYRWAAAAPSSVAAAAAAAAVLVVAVAVVVLVELDLLEERNTTACCLWEGNPKTAWGKLKPDSLAPKQCAWCLPRLQI